MKLFRRYFLIFFFALLVIFWIFIFTSKKEEKVLPPYLPAFPEAQGFGANTVGGRFGRILSVVNLNDTLDANSPEYMGSFRWALDSTWADDPASPYDQRRFIVFKIGGIINLQDRLVVSHPFTTIAAQSAPSPGIALRREGLTIETHDVILRGLRIRVGAEAGPDCCRDGLKISTSNATSDIYNVIVDHTSVSWAIDENVSFYVEPTKPYSLSNVTIQWTTISEGLFNSVHVDEGATQPDPHSMGLMIGNGAANISIHHNLLALNWGRNPRLSGVENGEVVNNVVYGWKDRAMEISGDKNIARVIGNYFRAVKKSKLPEIVIADSNAESKYFFDNNIADHAGSISNAKTKGAPLLSFYNSFPDSFLNIDDANLAYENVLNNAGAWTPTRDGIDERVINDVRSYGGAIIDDPLQVGGWELGASATYPNDKDGDGIPSQWEIDHGLDPIFAGDANNPNYLSPKGYAWIEEYVNSLIPAP